MSWFIRFCASFSKLLALLVVSDALCLAGAGMVFSAIGANSNPLLMNILWILSIPSLAWYQFSELKSVDIAF